MRSIADDLRKLTHRETLALPAETRVERALALGDEDARLFAEARGIPLVEARRRLAQARQLGRQPSRAAERP